MGRSLFYRKEQFLADGWKFGRSPENKLGRYANKTAA